MIAYLKGQVLKKTEKAIILDTGTPGATGGVGYLVHLPATTLSGVQEQQTLELFIHSNIREDAFDLYGFNTYSELTFFKTLISVSGIGPKSGLEILSNDTNKVKAAILNEDSAYLCKTPGIGQKTAKRLILELKNKIEIDDINALGSLTNSVKADYNSEPHPDAMDALLRLGYQRNQVTKTLNGMPPKITKAEEVITYFLKNN